jgi:hypothetical protein
MPGENKKKPERSGGRKLPEWVTAHFHQCLDSHETLFRIIRISQRGISALRAVPKAIEVVAKMDGKSDDPLVKEKLGAAEKDAELSSQEIAKGFPVLHALAAVALWSWLENFVKGLVALWLMHRKDAYTGSAVQRLRIKLGEYLQLPKSEQAHYVVELLEQELGSPMKRGATRFESLLEPLSLTGSLPEGCAKTLFELQQLRNAIAHRNSVVDRKLRTACPWLRLRTGQPVKISGAMLHRYGEAAAQYLLAVLYRVGDLYGHDLREKGASQAQG